MAKRADKTTSRVRRGGRGKANGAIVFAAIVVSAGLFFGLRSKTDAANVVNSTPVVSKLDSVRLPVPVEPVAAGTKLSSIRFRTVAYPVAQVPEGAIRNITSYLDAVAVTSLPANLPLFKQNVSHAAGSSNPVIESIPEGMRAMTIKVDATSAVEGWAGSGAIVDVLLVRGEGTSVVAEKVKILSAERSVNPVNGTESPNVPSTVTLLVSQDQCLAINTAIPLGKIAFALRSTTDDGGWHLTRYHADNLKNVANGDAARKQIQGFIEIEGKGGFALSNGQWVQAEDAPDGFRLNKKEPIKAQLKTDSVASTDKKAKE